MANPSKSPMKKLGHIGGRSKTPQAPAETLPPQSQIEKANEIEVENSTKTPTRKLGRIGGSAAKPMPTEPPQLSRSENGQSNFNTTKLLSPHGDQSRKDSTPLHGAGPPQSEKREPSPIPEEKMEELANKKREDLRRKLQTQGQAPSKKKRRF